MSGGDPQIALMDADSRWGLGADPGRGRAGWSPGGTALEQCWPDYTTDPRRPTGRPTLGAVNVGSRWRG
jgi:hypothetical protein